MQILQKDTKCQNGISSIPTSNWAAYLQADRFVLSESKSLIENNIFFLKFCHFDFWKMTKWQKLSKSEQGCRLMKITGGTLNLPQNDPKYPRIWGRVTSGSNRNHFL